MCEVLSKTEPVASTMAGAVLVEMTKKRKELRERCTSLEGVSPHRVAQEFATLLFDAFEMLSFGLQAVFLQLSRQEELLRERLPEQLYVGDVVVDPLEIERQVTTEREEKKTCERD